MIQDVNIYQCVLTYTLHFSEVSLHSFRPFQSIWYSSPQACVFLPSERFQLIAESLLHFLFHLYVWKIRFCHTSFSGPNQWLSGQDLNCRDGVQVYVEFQSLSVLLTKDEFQTLSVLVTKDDIVARCSSLVQHDYNSINCKRVLSRKYRYIMS